MRTQVTFKPRFWAAGSGKKLRGNPQAQVLALYLMMSPQSTMIGLYYESLVSILHETGLTEEQFRKALPEVREIALYDEQEGLVYLPEGAEHQIGETLSPSDKKRKAIISQLEIYGKHEFVRQWIERYYEPYHLSQSGISKPLRSPSEAPSMGHPASMHAPDPNPRSDPGSDPKKETEVGAEAPVIASLQARAQTWMRDPTKASFVHPDPHRWTEMLELRDLVAKTFGIEPDELRAPNQRGDLDPRVALVLERWAEGTDQARMRKAIVGAKADDLIASKTQLQTLQTIFKNAAAVDKYSKLAKGGAAHGAPVDISNRKRLTPEAAERRRKFLAGE
jgi:hypothetical protein